MSGQPTIQELLGKATAWFTKKGLPTARLDAEVLLAYVMGMERIDLYVKFDQPMEKDEIDRYRDLIGRRAKRVPVAYLRGFKEFYALTFQVNPAVLIPRPESELLVETALAWLKGHLTAGAPALVADVCTGSGCLGLALAKHWPGARVVASDISPEALAVARENAVHLAVADRVTFLQGDAFTPLQADEYAGQVDVLLVNPPYVSHSTLESLAIDIQYEPRLALDGGPDGLDFYRRFAPEAAALLKPGGLMLWEIGYDQGAAVAALLVRAADNRSVTVVQDYAGHDRMVRAERAGDYPAISPTETEANTDGKGEANG